MTLEERGQLTKFLQLLGEARAGVKDAEAESLIAQACSRQPDAAYLLVQRVLQLEHALSEAQQKEAAQKTSFVGDANAWGRAPAASQPSPQSPAMMQPVPLQPASMQQAPAAGPQRSAWGSGMLGTVAMTAGGVVAGSLLAQGIGSLFGNHNKPPADTAAIPPGGGTLAETDYGAASQSADSGYAAQDFDTGGDMGDVS